jgi:Fe-S cluster assembly protein SufD
MNADVRQIRTAAETALVESFAAAKGRLPGNGDIAARREAAFHRFEQHGLPHRRIEEWKYTDLRALMREAKPLAEPPLAAAKGRAKSAGVLGDFDVRRLVFVDGAFVPELSDLSREPGLTIGSLADALTRGEPEVIARLGVPGAADGDVAYALNTAFMGDGAVIVVAQGAQVARPIQLVFFYGSERAATVFARSLVVIEDGGSLTLLESHEGPDGVDYQTNSALNLIVGHGARADHVKIGREGARALHVSTLTATIGRDAQLRDFTFTRGGAVVRNQLFVHCTGAGTTLSLNGANLLRGQQHVDNTLVLDHAVGGCASREVFKSVLDDESRAVFQGKIIVRPDAQKTDARMMTQALLLSENAEADNKPELEIFADDVQCGHGATSGAIDENLKFYLMARGIPEKEAEALLIESFVGEAIDAIAHEGVKHVLMEAARQWLAVRK